MSKWYILVLIFQNISLGELLPQNDRLLDVGESMSNPVQKPCTLNAGDDILRDAVKVLQLEAIGDLKQTIKNLGEQNDEKDRQIEQMKKDNVEEITSIKEKYERKLLLKSKEENIQIEQMKKENVKEMTSIKEKFERKLLQKLKEENMLVKKLNGQTTLVNYLMNVFSKSYQVFEAKKDLIEDHAQEMKRLQTKLGECHKRHNANLKIIHDSHQTILTQKDSMDRLEKLIELEKQLSKSEQDHQKSECNTAPWIEHLTSAYTAQQGKIDELKLILEDKEKMEENMNNIQSSLSNIDQTLIVEECTVSTLYQQVLVRQSESISFLSKLASYATNTTSSIDYEKDENGRLVSASTCNCLPEPLKETGLKPSSIKYECENKANNQLYVNCVDGQCLNEYWPDCVQDFNEKDAGDDNEEDAFEWSFWSAAENNVFRTRTNKNAVNIYQESKVAGVLHRLPTTASSWGVRKGNIDAIDFTSTKKIQIRGISMFGSASGSATHNGLIQLKETVSQTILLSETFQYTSNGYSALFDKMFSSPEYASSGVKYTITVEYYNTASQSIWRGEGGQASFEAVSEGATVNFQFLKSAESTNGSGVSSGQIPRILFFY